MATPGSASYSIGRISEQCAATGEALTPGSDYVAALVERDEDDGLDRVDYSQQAWDAGARPKRLFGFWRGVVPEPGAKPRPFIDDASLLSLFEQLEEATTKSRLAFRFTLALLLIRKRLLRHAGTINQGEQRVMLVRARGADGWDNSAEPIEVQDPGMSDDYVADVTEQLRDVIQGEA